MGNRYMILKNRKKISDKAMNWVGSVGSLTVHTILFVGSFSLVFFGITIDKILLVVTTIVSLEAIYMAIFIQMAINQNTASLEEVGEDIEEIQKDVDDIQKDVDEIQKDVDEIEKDDEQLMYDQKTRTAFSGIESQLMELINKIETIRHEKNSPMN